MGWLKEDDACVRRRSPIRRCAHRRRALTRVSTIREDQPPGDAERDDHGRAEQPT